MKFLVPNYSCLQNPLLGGYRPQIPVISVLCPQLNLLTPPPLSNKLPRYATANLASLYLTFHVVYAKSSRGFYSSSSRHIQDIRCHHDKHFLGLRYAQ